MSDSMDDDSEPEAESTEESTTSSEESTEYGSEEKRRREHNYDTSMVDLESHIDCERDYESPWIPLNPLLIWKVCVIVRMWREKVWEKYTSLPGIRELQDFVTIAVSPNKIVMKVREKCYSGTLRDTPTKVKKDFNATDSCIPKVTDSYSARGNLRSLSENKMGHLQQMYANFIPQERWPDFIHSP